MNTNQAHRLHATIKGRVQGVGFRYFILRSAQANNLTGWVRNRYDGRVEVMAQGQLAHLNQLLADCRTGPLSSHVEKVDYQFTEGSRGEFSGFKVLSTA